MLQVKEIGLYESLVSYHQKRPVVMAALVVDPNKRCLVVEGALPMKPHVSIGHCSTLGPVPFLHDLIEQLRLVPKRIYQTGHIYDPYENPTPADTQYFVYRVDVTGSPVVPGGEWVMDAERARVVGGSDSLIVRCAQLFLGQELAWQEASAGH